MEEGADLPDAGGLPVAGWLELVRELRSLGQELASRSPATAADMGQAAAQTLPGLRPGDRPLVAFAVRLTLAPRTHRARHLDPLRAVGLGDAALHDVVQVIALFSHMNRLADGLGVTLEPHKHERALSLFGPAALADHLAWGAGG